MRLRQSTLNSMYTYRYHVYPYFKHLFIETVFAVLFFLSTSGTSLILTIRAVIPEMSVFEKIRLFFKSNNYHRYL